MRIASPARDARKKPRDRNELRAKRRGDGRGPWDFQRGLLPRVERGDAPRAQAGRGRRTFVCLGNNSIPSSSKSSLPLIARSGAYRDASRRAECGRLRVRLLLRVRCLFFSLLWLRKAGAGARGALRTRAPATRDARQMSISIGPASRADTRLARRALGHAFKEDFLAGLLSREKIQVKAQKRAREIRHLTV